MYLLTTTTIAKYRANNYNIATQQIATFLGSTCCARLASQLRHVDIMGVVEGLILEGVP